MREILFKGKHKDGEWSYGIPIQHIDGDYQIISGKSGAMCLTTVISNTIGQYTGLTDKNGTKIFEGDILQFTNNDNEQTNYEVLWFANKWVVLQCEMTVADDLDLFFVKHCVVIGNIYDNPELLEE